MQLKPIAVITVLLLIVAALSVAGCTINLPSTSSPTPTPTSTPIPAVSTPTPPADYSSYYNKLWERSGFIVERQFTKSTNARGNDVYMGIMRNTSLPQGRGVTTVIELTSSKAQSRQLYDKAVDDKSGRIYISL